MSNPRQNDACPCGSDKKYKKCCGMSNVIEISPQLYNEELDQLHDELLAYALGNYEEVFMEQTNIYFHPLLNDDTVAFEDYLTGLTLWTILNVPLLRNKQTIFDTFYSQQKGKIKRTRTRNTLLEWANTAPSVYEVLATDETGLTTVIELSTDKKFKVPELDEDDYLKGSIVIGSLVPFVGFHDFFFDVIELFEADKKEILSLMEDYPSDIQQFNQAFPGFLAEALLIDMVDLLDNPLDNEVEYLFKDHMTDKGFDHKIIDLGIDIWQTYTHIEEPNFKSPATYAAALEYLIQRLIVEDYTITQKEIAEEYGTSAGTVSTNYRKFKDFIEQSIDDYDFQLDSYESFNIEREGIDKTPPSLRDQAQNLLYEARETQGIKRKQLIEEALALYPNSPDAYLLLAEDADTELEFGTNLKKAVQVGEKDLGKAFFLENKGHFWMMIETRPYMRAKAMYADFLYETGAEEDAFKQFEEMLRLNPNDNQGIRYILLTLYIESAQYKKAQDLINDFKDEATASFMFNKILVDYLLNGLTSQTKTLINEANEQNPFVKNYLLGKKKLPNKYLDHIGFGDETEAIVYTQENIHLWEECPELLKEL